MNERQPTSDPLPAPIQRALDQLATDLGNMPRECARDPAALCIWKGIMARQARRIKAMRVSPRVLRIAVPVEVARVGKRKGRGGRAQVRQQMEMGL